MKDIYCLTLSFLPPLFRRKAYRGTSFLPIEWAKEIKVLVFPISRELEAEFDGLFNKAGNLFLSGISLGI